MNKILIIDDEPQIRRFLQIGLTSQSYTVVVADSGNQGLAMSTLEQPNLIILDLGLPDMEGIEVLTTLREFSNCPVIVLTARDKEIEKVKLLDAGANDYVVKPFGIQELLARIRALLRDTGNSEQAKSIFDDGRLHLDILKHKVAVRGEEIHLSRKEFKLLSILVENENRVMTQKQLMDQIWGKSHENDTHYLRILVKKLRTKLSDDAGNPEFIETEPGVGYRFLPASRQ